MLSPFSWKLDELRSALILTLQEEDVPDDKLWDTENWRVFERFAQWDKIQHVLVDFVGIESMPRLMKSFLLIVSAVLRRHGCTFTVCNVQLSMSDLFLEDRKPLLTIATSVQEALRGISPHEKSQVCA